MTLSRLAVLAVLLCLAAIPGLPAAARAESAKKATLEDVKEQTRAFLLTLKDYSAAQRDEAIAATRKRLDDLDAHIEALEADIAANWGTMNEAARREAQAQLKTLRRQRNAVAEAYGRWRESSEEAWEQLKQGFGKAYADLQDAWDKAEREFGRDDR